MNYDQIETLNNTLKSIEGALGRIANALEQANKPKGLGNPMWTGSHVNCISKDEIPLPTPWNNDNKPNCKSDILYKEPEKPNWYNISDHNFTNNDLTNELYK
jgi:hypothetical protein